MTPPTSAPTALAIPTPVATVAMPDPSATTAAVATPAATTAAVATPAATPAAVAMSAATNAAVATPAATTPAATIAAVVTPAATNAGSVAAMAAPAASATVGTTAAAAAAMAVPIGATAITMGTTSAVGTLAGAEAASTRVSRSPVTERLRAAAGLRAAAAMARRKEEDKSEEAVGAAAAATEGEAGGGWPADAQAAAALARRFTPPRRAWWDGFRSRYGDSGPPDDGAEVAEWASAAAPRAPAENLFAVTMIVANESKTLWRSLRSLAGVLAHGSALLCDNGSKDGTPRMGAALLSAAGVPGAVTTDRWGDFGTNRTRAFRRAREHPATRDARFLFWVDADEAYAADRVLPLTPPTAAFVRDKLVPRLLSDMREGIEYWGLYSLMGDMLYYRPQIAVLRAPLRWFLPAHESLGRDDRLDGGHRGVADAAALRRVEDARPNGLLVVADSAAPAAWHRNRRRPHPPRRSRRRRCRPLDLAALGVGEPAMRNLPQELSMVMVLADKNHVRSQQRFGEDARKLARWAKRRAGRAERRGWCARSLFYGAQSLAHGEAPSDQVVAAYQKRARCADGYLHERYVALWRAGVLLLHMGSTERQAEGERMLATAAELCPERFEAATALMDRHCKLGDALREASGRVFTPDVVAHYERGFAVAARVAWGEPDPAPLFVNLTCARFEYGRLRALLASHCGRHAEALSATARLLQQPRDWVPAHIRVNLEGNLSYDRNQLAVRAAAAAAAVVADADAPAAGRTAANVAPAGRAPPKRPSPARTGGAAGLAGRPTPAAPAPTTAAVTPAAQPARPPQLAQPAQLAQLAPQLGSLDLGQLLAQLRAQTAPAAVSAPTALAARVAPLPQPALS